MADYRFVTTFELAAPLASVREAVAHPERWAGHWPELRAVEVLSEGDPDGVAAARRVRLRAVLPYILDIETTATRSTPAVLEVRASGDLEGTALAEFEEFEPDLSWVRSTWSVRTTPRWMNVLAPVGRRLFEWCHGVAMTHAVEALATHLDAAVVSCHSYALRKRRRRGPAAVWLAATARFMDGGRRKER